MSTSDEAGRLLSCHLFKIAKKRAALVAGIFRGAVDMIDVTTKAGMDRIIELYAYKSVGQIIRENGLKETEKNLKHRIMRYIRDGAVLWRRKCMSEEVIRGLADRGLSMAAAAREIEATPVQVQRAARYYGITFTGGTSGRQAVEKPAKYDPPPSATLPDEIRALLAGRWANATQPSIFLVGR